MSEIVISPKHKPLFKLLAAWKTVFNDRFFDLDDNEKFDVISRDNQIDYYKPSFLDLSHEKQSEWIALTRVDTVLEYGGRDSGKSFATSLFVPLAVHDHGHRCLYTRYVMNTTDHSISSALDERINLLGYAQNFDYANNSYALKDESKPGKIFITGQKTSSLNQTAKLKSLEDFSMFITDEAEEMKSFDEWNKIKRSLRGEGIQNLAILVFNPPTKAHWLYEEFFEEMGIEPGFCGVKENVLYIHTTYKDNIKHVQPNNLREYTKLENYYNRYLAADSEERLNLPAKVKKGYKKYKSEVLGGFMDAQDGVIYEDWEIGEFPEFMPSVYGLDFGSSDPDALVECAIDHNERILYVRELFYDNNVGFEQLFDILVDRCGYNGLIVTDHNEKRLRLDFRDMGLNIRKAKKGRVKDRIKKIQSFTIVVDPKSVNMIKSLNNYVWKDERSGLPDHNFSHLPNAMEYAYNELTV